MALIQTNEALHTGNYTKITQQCGCLFYLKGTPPKGCFRLSFLVEKVELVEPSQISSVLVAVIA